MADTHRPPVLPSTADTTPYVPVSWMAVGAFGAAVLFVVVIVLFGLVSALNRKPLMVPEALLLAALAVVLSFTGRRIILNSEGTRTGLGLTNAAWWTAVVAGLTYAAYIMAIDFAVRREADAEAQKWFGFIANGEVNRAFHRTLPPDSRTGAGSADERTLRARYRNAYLAFDQSDVVRQARRNPKECTFTTSGLKEWVQEGDGVRCVLTGVVKSPEGEFPLSVAMRASVVKGDGDAGGRQWQVIANADGYMSDGPRTGYGWRVLMCERTAGAFARDFHQTMTVSGGQMWAYLGFVRPGGTPEAVRQAVTAMPGVAALGGGLGTVFSPPADYTAAVNGPLFALPGGGPPSDEQRRRFQFAWETRQILGPGARLNDSPDKNLSVSVSDAGLEARVPVELGLPIGAGSAAARGRLVLSCTDPAVLAELSNARKTAASETPSAGFPPALATFNPPWRLVRIESDLVEVPVAKGPPGPGDDS